MLFGANNMEKRLRVFVDTSALLAGLNPPSGVAGTILSACFSKRLIPVISRQVIEEAERNIAHQRCANFGKRAQSKTGRIGNVEYT